MEAYVLTVLMIAVLTAPLVAIYACRVLHRWLYQQTGSRLNAALLGGVLGAPVGAVISASPMYLYIVITAKLLLHKEGLDVAAIITMMLALGGAVIGILFGAWPTRME